jgi:hypothetical protein
MFKFFDEIGKKTYINTTLHCQAMIAENSRNIVYLCKPTFKPCETEDDFQFIYDWIKLELSTLNCRIYSNFEFNIKISGKLNGKTIDEEFDDIDAYRQYLVSNSLLVSNLNLVH